MSDKRSNYLQPSMWQGLRAHLSHELIVIALAALLAAAFASTISGFASWGNAMALVRSVSILGIFALGMAVVIICRGIDLSQVAVALVSAGIAAVLINDGTTVPLALLAGLLIALGLGLTNGAIVAYLEIPALFASLASALLFMGLARSVLLPSTIINLPAGGDAPLLALGRNWAGVPVPAIVFALCAIVLHLILARTILGRFIYALGDNPDTAHVSGLPVRRLIVTTFATSAVIGYVGGLVMVASTAMVDLGTVNSTMIFDVILVAVAGGVSLSGGSGGVASVFAGTFFIGVLLNSMSLLDLTSQYQNIIKGAVLLAVIVLDSRLRPQDEETARHGV